jgi:glycosyltransferase involved in cell wall biosynthesis
MRDAVEKLASDPSLSRRMGERGRDYVCLHFDRRTIAAELQKVLQDTAAGR